MKRNSDNPPSKSAPQDSLRSSDLGDVSTQSNDPWSLQQEQTDPLWNLLGEASNIEPSAFFARNVVRETRLEEKTTASWGTRLVAFFTPTKLAIGAAACVCALAVAQMWPSPETITETGTIADNSLPEPSSDLTELVIGGSLDAAAEDPTIFTRDEVVAMIGF